MSTLIEKDQWVWVIIQDPGGVEQFLGQQDAKKDEEFIPVFLEKEEAQQGLSFLARKKGLKYEVQAIQYEDLSQRAGEYGFLLFVLNGAGEVLEKIKM
jgi:DNA-binding phage protein